MTPYAFERHARSGAAIATLATIYAALLAALYWLDAAPWLIGALALTTLPALRDVIAAPLAGLRLTDDAIAWHSGRRHGRVERSEIVCLRLDRRWDFSVRAALMLADGKRIHLPQESLPPHQVLEAEATARGLRVERHPFSPF